MSEKSLQESKPNKHRNIEQLQARSLALQQELDILRKTFADGFSENSFDYIPEKSSEQFINQWLWKVREKTALLKNSDNLGMRIFGNNLEQQNALPFQKYSKRISISFVQIWI